MARPGYIEITMKIMMSDSHNLPGEAVTPAHGLNITNNNISNSANIRPTGSVSDIVNSPGTIDWR